jgi:hypothetical protein
MRNALSSKIINTVANVNRMEWYMTSLPLTLPLPGTLTPSMNLKFIVQPGQNNRNMDKDRITGT